MKTFDLVVPCHFGLEAVTKREIYDLGYEITKVEDGRVTFTGDAEAICRANIFLRGAERVLLLVGRFHATTFDELFEGIALGRLYSEGWKVLGKEGFCDQKQAFQSFGYPVDREESDGGAYEAVLSSGLVSGGWGKLSGTHFPAEG